MVTSSSHILFSKLVDMVDNKLPAGEAAGITAHLSTCKECSELEGRLREVLALMRADTTESAPDYALARVIAMLPQPAPASSAIKRILATLRFDTIGLSPAYGTRSEATAERQLLYEAGETQLHLQVSPAGDQWVITGQVLGPQGSGRVELSGESGLIEASLDDRCEFELPPVTPGSYWMVLRLSDLELEVPELKLGV